MFINSKVNLLTSSLKEEISNMRSEGQSAGFVRRKLDLDVLPKFLYESSRTAIRERYQHQVQNLIQNSESKYIKLFFIQHFWDDQTYLGSTFISRRFFGMLFAEDILLVDDTSCNNKFNYPIIVAIGLDENRISQLIGFGIIPGKNTDNFDQFFEPLSQKYSVRVFVCDRLRAQAKSIKKYFNSHIIYCKIHIRRNIISYFNSY